MSSLATEPALARLETGTGLNRFAVVAILLLAAWLRGLDAWRPVDGTVRDSWREPDVAGMARNFYREGMDIFHPRIDWRGDGPGFVESECPIYPWTVACLYHVFGYHEEIGRVVSYVFSFATCIYFLFLARLLLDSRTVVYALLLFAINPLAIRLAASAQPEPLMFLGYTAGAFHFLAWCRERRSAHYWAALFFTVLGILAKLPAIHIGILFALAAFQTFGWSALRRRDIWLFAIVALLVPILWYWHARNLWLEYGNSLGISNEAYRRITAGGFLSAIRTTLSGNAEIEMSTIYMPSGLLLAAAGLYSALGTSREWPILFWLAALAAYYVVTGRTTGDASWAAHYHIVSVPAACLVMGAGFSLARRFCVPRNLWRLASLVIAVLGVISCTLGKLHLSALEGRERELLYGGILMIATAAIQCIPRVVQLRSDDDADDRKRRWAWAACVPPIALCGVFALTLLLDLRMVSWERSPNRYVPLYECALEFKPKIAPGSLIVASGANEVDSYGGKRAYNAPYMFFWTDTKGFNIGNGEQSLEKLEELRRRGARYFIAERHNIEVKDGFERALRAQHRVLAERPEALLLELAPYPAR